MIWRNKILILLALATGSHSHAQMFNSVAWKNSQEADSSWIPQSANIVGMWHLNNDFMASIGANLTASGAGATITSVSPAVGTGSATFGSSHYAAAAVASTYDFPNATFTVSSWIQTSAATADFFVSNGGVGGGWAIYCAGGPIAVAVKNCSNGQVGRTSITNINNGKWHHVVIVITTNTTVEANNDIQIYIDGSLNQASLSLPGTGAYCNPGGTKSITLGARNVPTSPANPFNGNLDEVIVWNVGLTAGEIKKIYLTQQRN